MADPSSRLLRQVAYGLLIVTALGTMVGRILHVRSSLGKTPLLSANDRSRWCAVRAMVDLGVYHIDDVIYDKRGKRNREWYSIDMVRHRGPDGREHYYSSKPPLLAVVVSAEYWVLRSIGLPSIEERPFYIIRLLLIINHLLMLGAIFWAAIYLAERWCRSDIGRIFAVAAIAWGTMLGTFAVTLNNHIPAATAVMLGLVFLDRIWRPREQGEAAGKSNTSTLSLWDFLGAGIMGGLAAAHELPALSFLALTGGLLLLRSPLFTFFGYLPGVAIVAFAFFGSTYATHQSWAPPYAHRSDGEVIAELTVEPADLADGNMTALRPQLNVAGVEVSDAAEITPGGESRWVLWDEPQQMRYALVLQGETLKVRSWNQWYEYDVSYWKDKKKQGVDRGEQDRGVYAFHVLIGHHGVFSLTPLWMLSVIGLVMLWLRGDRLSRGAVGVILLLSVVCLSFYIARPLADRNYGGVTCCFRWALWLIPLWWLALTPAADAFMKQGFLRQLAWLALLVSVMSASYAASNPWSHPWIYNYWEYLGYFP